MAFRQGMLKGWIGLVRVFLLLFRWLPWWLLRRFVFVISFLLQTVVPYRKTVIRANLTKSFPNLSTSEIDDLVRGFYRNFATVLVEFVKGYAVPPQQLVSRYSYSGIEEIKQTLSTGASVFIWASHLGNWEWGTLTLPSYLPDYQVYGVYKPLQSTLAGFIESKRQAGGMTVVPMAQIVRHLAANHYQPAVYVFIADQTPFKMNGAVWLPFLNQWTPFFKGPEQLAERYSAVIFTGETKRLDFGKYEVAFAKLAPQPEDFPDTPYTAAYAKWLEQAISKQPQNWLWSHRRWKRRVPKELES